MGQLSLLLVIAAFFIGGIVVYNANTSATRADEKVWEHQYHVIARDAATTGMARAVRVLGEELNQDWSVDASTALNALSTPQTYESGTYTVTYTTGSCSGSVNNANLTTMLSSIFPSYPTGYSAPRDLIEIQATGTINGSTGGDTKQSHRIVACYLQTDFNDPQPPSFQYSFISNEDFDFNGGPEIQAYLEGSGSVHSNEEMDLGPKVVIDGHATMTDTVNSVNKGSVASFGKGNMIPMVQFDPEDFRISNGGNIPEIGSGSSVTDAFRYDSGSMTFSDGMMTLSPPSGGDKAGDPWVWFIDGDLTVSGNAHLVLPQWTTVVVNGKLNVQAGANVTVTPTLPPARNAYPGGANGDALYDADLRAWIGTQLLDDEHAPLAWYVDGDEQWLAGEGDDRDNQLDDVVIGGGGAMIGNIYTNGDFKLDGGGGGTNLVGSIAAYGEILGNGGGNGNNFWFLEVGQENIIDGVLLPGKQIVRLALAEWTDPVLQD